ncbi:MAG: FG-GAP-like repeat-containing protein, partial [Terracidiphilus sp.]|nr:FG-GAP-like repeat-containing protein [Terracidiphilus sp.]
MLVCARRWVLALLAACSVCNVSGLVFHKSVAGTLNNSTQAVAIGAFTANASLLSIVATTVVNFDQSVYNFVPTAGYSDYTKSSLCTHCVSASAMMVTADIDGDGFLDIVSADEADGIVLWYKNINGTGNFSVNTVATSVSGVTGLAVGDMNNDGLLDIISSARYGEPSGQVNAHLQTRTSSNITWFTTLIGDTNAPTDLTVIDFNNDGLLDVLVASFGDANIQILLQEENYGFAFTPVIVVDTCQDPTGVSAGDIDGDGILDVAATCGGANQVVWAANDGELKFITTLVSTNSFNARQVTIVDLDLDGRKDLLVAVNINSTLSWFRNLGSGTSFEEITLSNTLYGIWSFALGDIDGNGGLDIVTASLYYNQLTVFLQDAPSPSTTPSVTPTPSATPSVTPSAAPGSCVDGVCPANSFKFVTTAWSACGSACGGGVSFRNAYCTDGLGRISPDPGPCLSQGGMPSTVQRCNSQACAALYWVPNTHWGACSHACDDGTGNSLGISTRTAPTCYNGSHTVAPDATTGLTPCDSQAGLVRPSTTQSCNRFPCPAQVFSWNTTAWSACAALATTGCGPTIGMRSRTVTCSSSANTRATGVLCPSPQPAANETCIITRPCACSNNTDCGGGN